MEEGERVGEIASESEGKATCLPCEWRVKGIDQLPLAPLGWSGFGGRAGAPHRWHCPAHSPAVCHCTDKHEPLRNHPDSLASALESFKAEQ